MEEKIGHVVTAFNKIDSRILIFIILCSHKLTFQLTSNEEMYFALAKQFADPDWMPYSFAMNQFVGTRLVFEYIIGNLLQLFSFEQIAFWSRVVNFLLLAFPLAKIFRHFKIPNIAIFILFELFFIRKQAFFANEWIFQSCESKTLAYIFLFYSIYFLFTKKYMLSTIFIAIATWFHVLVGGWFFGVLMLYMLSISIPFKQLIVNGFLYVLIISPFFVFIFTGLSESGSNMINGIDTNWVYVYYRNAHHTAIFKDFWFFWHRFMPGVVITLILFGLCIFYFPKFSHNKPLQKLNRLNIIIFSLQIISLIIALFDRSGFYLKYYPFRTSALSNILMMIQFIVFFMDYRQKRIIGISYSWLRQHIYTIILLVGLPIYIYYLSATISDIAHTSDFDAQYPELDELARFAGQNSQPDDVFLFLGFEDKRLEILPFFRKSERNRFVAEKFIPTTNRRIYEWYVRMQEREKVEKNIDYLNRLREKYQIDYIVTNKKLDDYSASNVFNNKKFFVYMIKEERNE